LSNTYGLASREMSLVAVVKRAGDRPGELPETRVVRLGMPEDTAFAAYFAASQGPGMFTRMMGPAAPPVGAPMMHSMLVAPSAMPPSPAEARGGPMEARGIAKKLGRVRKALFSQPEASSAVPEPPSTIEDELMELAAMLEPDGGMPGRDSSTRAARSAAAVFAFAAAGHTLTGGAFRSHVARLIEFLKSVTGLPASEQKLVDQAIEASATGRAPTGDWLRKARH